MHISWNKFVHSLTVVCTKWQTMLKKIPTRGAPYFTESLLAEPLASSLILGRYAPKLAFYLSPLLVLGTVSSLLMFLMGFY